MTTTLSTAESVLASDIESFRLSAQASFSAALNRANAPQPPNQSDQEKRDWSAETAKAKAQMASALQQLVHVATMLSEQRGRVGYDALVSLMENTRDTVKAVYDRIGTLLTESGATNATGQAARDSQLTTLAGVLQALARIAPVAGWQKPAAPDATAQ